MLGGSAAPTAWKAFPATPVTGVRRIKCLPSWPRFRIHVKSGHKLR